MYRSNDGSIRHFSRQRNSKLKSWLDDRCQGKKRTISKWNFASSCFVHLSPLWSWMVCWQPIRWLVVFVCNALTWYSSSPPFNLFGPEPTLNAQIASFHRDSSVSRAVLLHWAPNRPLGHCLPCPEKEVEPVGPAQWSGLVLISCWRCFV